MDLKERVFRALRTSLVYGVLFMMLGCGPLVMTTGISEPPPPWFYPNRLEVVRYVYFPDHNFYFDLSTHVYIYLDRGIWVRRRVLPPRYRVLDLRRSRYERIKGYRNDDIKKYHDSHNADRGRSNRNTPKKSRSN